MKRLIALLLVALAAPALADPKAPPKNPKGANLDKQNEAIDKGMIEAGQKADIAMSRRNPSTNHRPVQGSGGTKRQ